MNRVKLKKKLKNSKKSNLKIMLGFDCDRPRGKFIKTEEGAYMAKSKFNSLHCISETLEELEIPRTFFICGQFLESMAMMFGKEEMKKSFCINSPYVEIGDHSYSHSTVKKILTRPDKIPISPEEVENEFKKNTDIFKNIFGLNIPNRSYRTPLGHADGLKDNEKLQDQYYTCKKIGIEMVIAEAQDKLMDSINTLENSGKMDNSLPFAHLIKEMQSNAKWLSSVLSPVKYGKDTKLTLNGGDKPIEIKWQQ